ncbi:MAG: hypothetical protein WAN20_17745 [Pseudonocardiaceae bacterium]
MASDRTPSAQWSLAGGQAWVFLADRGMDNPFVLAADVQDAPTDLAAFVAGLDHESYSFLSALRSAQQDVIVLGNGGKADLDSNAGTVTECVRRAVAERLGERPLNVLGIGRGAVTTRYALAKMEDQRIDHQTGNYFSYNGSVPSAAEAQRLAAMGSWPARPRLLKAVSGEFRDELDNDYFDQTTVGDRNPAGALITKQLGSWIIDRAG